MAEAYNSVRGQWIGRSAQNKTVNFTAAEVVPITGGYYDVRITATFPNSLVGELVSTNWLPERRQWPVLPVLQQAVMGCFEGNQ